MNFTSLVCLCLSLSKDLLNSLSMSICIQRSPKLTVVVHSKCSTLQAHSFVYLYQMLAGFLSPYQLVLSVFLSLSDVSWASLYNYISYCLRFNLCLALSLSKDLLNTLSTTVSKALLFLCLILSISKLFKMSNLLSSVNASLYYVKSMRARQLWVCVIVIK